nr:hypothetical protein [Tanacetum cinerariifolium]
MDAAAMKHMASNFAKLDKFKRMDFRRWQKKMHFLISSMSVVYILTTPIPKDGGDDVTVEQIRKRAKVQDTDKPKGNNVAGPSVVNIVEHNNSSRIAKVEKLATRLMVQAQMVQWMDDDVAWWVDSRARVHVCKDRCWFKTYESLNDGSILYMGNESTTLVHGRGCVDLRVPNKRKMITPYALWTKRKPNLNYLRVWGCREFVRLLDPKLKTLDERGIECIFVGYAEHSKVFRFYVIELNDSVLINSIIESRDAIFNENRFSSVPRPSLGIPHGTEDIGDSVVPEEMDVKIDFLNNDLDEEEPKKYHQKFDEVVLSNGYLLNQTDKCVYNKFDEIGKGVIICLYIDDLLIFGTDQVQVDLTNEFLSSRFSMKDMGEADVILVIMIKHKMSTPMDTSEKLMPNDGQAVSQVEYSRVIGCLMYAMTCTRLDITFVMGKLSKYTSNPVLEGYVDACWISNTKDNSSISGWVFMLGGAAGKEAEWLKNFPLEIPFGPNL